jgi:multiple antibiotic resistance protein
MRRVVQEGEESQENNDIYVFLLVIPLIVGPCTLTTILLFTDNSDLTGVAAVMEVLLAVLLIVHVSLLFAPRVINVLRRTFANVPSRILGVLLAAL